MNTQLSKDLLRKEVRQRKSKYSKEELILLSKHTIQKLEQDEHFQKATTLLCYYSLPDEVFTADFISYWKREKQIFLPKVNGDILTIHTYLGESNLAKGAYHILEPTSESLDIKRISIDLAIIPGMGFDKEGNRLGRGKGFYDKLLANLPKSTYKIGIAFPFQLFDEIPTTSLDIKMDKVII